MWKVAEVFMQEIHILEEDYYLSTIYAAGEHLSTRDMP
jgi:hypothetical protein